jgi:predicted GNAT superfamily acetyltransferase
MIQIRSCEGMEELDACVQLEIETWGYDESELIPRKTFLLAQKIGGQVIGAFDAEISTQGGGKSTESLIGFAMSLPGVKTESGHPRPYLHSHMLAVKERYRDRGIGVELKRKQRDEALSRGIRHMEWTFDPLEIKNAFLNIHRLGATVRTYRPDFYGVSSSRLQGGLPTDRLLAEWALDSPRVEAILAGRPAASYVIEERITVPASIYEWKASHADRERALAVQMENRRKFQLAFSQGLGVLGFSRDAEGNGVFELGSLTQLEQFFHTEDHENL